MAQLVHNLEHGGIYILYGPRSPPRHVAELRSFYNDHTRGTILAPLPSLGNKIALGAWTTKDANDPTNGTAHLAKSATIRPGRLRGVLRPAPVPGPERFPADALLPGPASPGRGGGTVDAAGLNPAVLRDMGVRVPPPAFRLQDPERSLVRLPSRPEAGFAGREAELG